MLTRRRFLTLAPSIVGLCTIGSSVFATVSTLAASDAELKRQMLGKLTTELNDATLANTQTQNLFKTLFNWDTATFDLNTINTIVAYSFGYRPALNGNTMPESGPINEQIADAVYMLYQMNPVLIYAQWEVASILKSKYHLESDKVISVANPTINTNGVVTASIDQVADMIVKKANSAIGLGKVAIFTHADQQSLAIDISKIYGMNAAIPKGIVMPISYDIDALPAQNRRRDLYILTNLSTRMGLLRTQLINQKYPNG
ncbi:hypothetical protein [Acinetobacter ursingii]|uniref:hypothetical protein n=1 Tax=Acinetobacter ursingii TaxID=108980 RepID=UPI0019574263|nr:hypothetical protein [Acinetobacter ursingii]VTX75227.1 Uncharacterised protein [Acinetobacter ursingii]